MKQLKQLCWILHFYSLAPVSENVRLTFNEYINFSSSSTINDVIGKSASKHNKEGKQIFQIVGFG